MASGRTLIHATIGAVVGIVLSFVPLSTVIGGAVAGFLEGPDSRDGAVVGAFAGVITFLPFVGLGILALGVFGVGMSVVAAPIEGFALAAFVVAVFALFLFVYTVGLTLLGGYLGAVLAREYPAERARFLESIGLSPERPRPSDRLQSPDPSSTRTDDLDRETDRPGVDDSSRRPDTERDRS